MTTQSYDHLTELTRATLSWSKPDRIAYNWRDSWIKYRVADEILSDLEEAFNRPSAMRPLNELIVAPPGNGKTALLHEIGEAHPNVLITSPPGNGKTGILRAEVNTHPEVGAKEVEVKPVVYALTPADCNEGKLWSEFLKRLGYPNYDIGPVITKKRIVLNALIQCQTKLILVDEVHNMLVGRAKAEKSLAVLKNISTETGRPIVFAGTNDAREVLEFDTQLTTRLTMHEIPIWKNDYEFARLLYGMQATLSLHNLSSLHEDPLRTKIFDLSKGFDTNPTLKHSGILVNVLNLVRFAAGYAIRDGTEKILSKHLELAASKKQWKGGELKL